MSVSQAAKATYLRGPDDTMYVVAFDGRTHRLADANDFVDAGQDRIAELAVAVDRMPAPLFTGTAAHFDTGNQDLGAGHYMQTSGGVTIQDGTLSALTHTFTVTDLGGFHGAVMAVLEDAVGNVIPMTPQGQQPMHRYGVDGRWVGQSDRHDPWVLNYSPSDVSRAVAVRLFHTWAPDSFQTILNKWTSVGGSAKQLADDVAAIAKDYRQTVGGGTGS